MRTARPELIDTDKNEKTDRKAESDDGTIVKVEVSHVTHKDTLFKTILNIMFLGLGTSALAIVKVPFNISIIFTPVCIVVGGICNIWSYRILGDLYEKYKITDYERLTEKIHGFGVKILLFVTLNIYTVGLILIHQVLTYRLLGGIVNVIGNYGYDSMLEFLEKEFWSKIWCKFAVNFGIGILIIYPLCLMTDMKKLNVSSLIGVFTTLLMLLIVLVQFPGYVYHFVKEYGKDNWVDCVNFYNVDEGFTRRVYFIQYLALFFFCFTGHNGLLPALEHLENPTPQRRNFLYNMAIGMDMIIYFIISVTGYLSVPKEGIEIVFERKRIWDKDIVMTIGRIGLIPMAISKIQVNHNIWRISYFSTISDGHENLTLRNNLIFTAVTLLITTTAASAYQNVVGYISLIGCFCVVIPAFLIPALLYMKDNGRGLKDWKNLVNLIIGSLLCIIGYISGALSIVELVDPPPNKFAEQEA